MQILTDESGSKEPTSPAPLRAQGSPAPAAVRARTAASALLGSAFYLLLFSNLESVAPVVQVAAIALVIGAGGLLFFKRQTHKIRPSAYELVLMATAILSFAVILFRPDLAKHDLDQYVLSYTVVFALTIFGASFCARGLDLSELLDVIAWALLAMLVTIGIFHSEDIRDALTPGAAERWALRTRAFGLHPNLEGFIFGGAAFLLLRCCFSGSTFKRSAFAVGVGASIALVFAASARSSLIAIIVTLLVVSPFYLGRLSNRMKLIAAAITLVALAWVIVKAGSIGNYIDEILELHSASRGLQSGGSGRLSLWAEGIKVVGSGVGQFLFGSGLRSSSPELIGFSTENSYITIAIDSGTLVALLLTTSMLACVGHLRRALPLSKNGGISEITALATIIYAMVESVFNRYLLAVGNPLSLFLFIVFIKVSLGVRSQKRVDHRSAGARAARPFSEPAPANGRVMAQL